MTTGDFATFNSLELRLRSRSQQTLYHSVSITTVRDGSAGRAGKTGRFFYYAKEYDGTPSHYYMEATQAPYVKVGNSFYMLDNGGEEPTLDAQGRWYPSTGPGEAGDTAWTLMSSQQQYYIARAFFGENAYLGSFIINNDWMISQYGTLYAKNGTPYTIDETGSGQGFDKDNAYTMFNPNYPVTSDPNGINFCPNYAVDGKTGKTYQSNAYIRGTVMANLFYSRTKWFNIDLNDHITYNIDPEKEPYANFGATINSSFYGEVNIYLPSATIYDGIEFNFFSFPFQTITVNAIFVYPTNSENLYYYSENNQRFVPVTNVSPYRGSVKIKAYGGAWFVTEGNPAVTI